jgi:hypothetical protein
LSKEEEGAYIFGMKQVPVQWTPIKNLLSANQFFSLIDMKRRFINSDNHKFHQYQ